MAEQGKSSPRARSGARRQRGRARLRAIQGALVLAVVSGTALAVIPGSLAQSADSVSCKRTLRADVVALDQTIVYNRLGAFNPGGMMYALRRDVVPTSGTGPLEPGRVKLRSDKRPRPLVLRMNVGDCIQVAFENLLSPTRAVADQPVDRTVGFSVAGLTPVGATQDGSWQDVDPIAAVGGEVGRNGAKGSGLVAPGEHITYKLYGEYENTFLIRDSGVTLGAEGSGGTTPFGLFGAVNVEPVGSVWFRSQVSRDEMDAAASAWNAAGDGPSAGDLPVLDDAGKPLVRRASGSGQPYVNYEARDASGTPILAMLDGDEIVHSDLNAIISGPKETGWKITKDAYPQSYWDNQIYNMGQVKGEQPFREFTVIFHDEAFGRQAFPGVYSQLKTTLHPTTDTFMINYGSGGIGSEIIANRVGVGPMWDCTDCKAEEFFLTSWAVGDPAMIVDHSANEGLTPTPVPDMPGAGPAPTSTTGPKATKAYYADDPSNTHHSYMNDRVKFRNLHAGPKEHHVFHLHAHQWQFDWNTKKSVYLDSQGIGPNEGYTYEIAYGGSGNRNHSVGDSIFHCHFYPHFAQGMWALWRSHDTFEEGTALDADGRPVAGGRALPDAEIQSGTPIPGVVPLPGQAMAPMPDGKTRLATYDLNGDGTADSSQMDTDGNGTADMAEANANGPESNPGYPFFIPGLAGHRPPTPPLDIKDDGGLPRHVITSGPNAFPGATEHYETRLDLNKTVHRATAVQLPETGTPVERVAMRFHGGLPGGPAVPSPRTPVSDQGAGAGAVFPLNGLPAEPGAPYANPCRTDAGVAIPKSRTYKGANIQLDLKMNKKGWHFQQQRILTLWDDAVPTLRARRAPEPLVMRLNAGDCAQYEHTNLTPNVYELDDYQVRTPTDIIGQHIHLVKFDVTSSDGSANGWNYEDGTLSPDEVRERIDAINAGGGLISGTAPGRHDLVARKHPFLPAVGPQGQNWLGARTTIQRWYADPLLNDAWDGGVGSVFTHDHYGPSTHQQVGLYSTVLVEPKATTWRDPETGRRLGSRTAPTATSSGDGGPTSWKADILFAKDDPATPGVNEVEQSHREFYMEFSDFQHAYEKGRSTTPTKLDNGAGTPITSFADFGGVINPSNRQEPPAGRKADLLWFPPTCAPSGADPAPPRPCPEAISADDPGTVVVNYRNEPVGQRVFDPRTGRQAAGAAGDLSRAFSSSVLRADPALNGQPAWYPPLTGGVRPGDPYTPLLRTYQGDQVRIRMQAGGQEEQHNMTVHGVKWRQEGLNPTSGWRNSQFAGISEYFNLEMPIVADPNATGDTADYAYEIGAQSDDLWNGVWGLMRSYKKPQADLLPLPNNPRPGSVGAKATNAADFQEMCPKTAPVRRYDVVAVQGKDVLPDGKLVYNARSGFAGALSDPDALMYVQRADLDPSTGKLRPGVPVEPLILRATAGDCVKVTLENRLPARVTDRAGYNALPGIVPKSRSVEGGMVTFNNNDLTPSSNVALHPQLVQYDVTRSDGATAGLNPSQTVAPGGSRTYTWYAGTVDLRRQADGTMKMVAIPEELGAVNLLPADRIKGPSKGLVGALIVEPSGASWTLDPDSRAQATVRFDALGGRQEFREFVAVLQDDLNLRYTGGDCPPDEASLVCAVQDIASESGGVPEDVEDSGQKGVNYRTEPLWNRFGFAPATTFGDPDVLDRPDLHKAYSNDLVGGDPQTPVFRATPTIQSARLRLLQPGGHTRGHVFTVQGHAWQREPYVLGDASSQQIAWTFHADPTNLFGADPDGGAGHNLVGWWTGTQGGISAGSHFDLVLRPGGRAKVQGDYRYGDAASFGNLSGLWGVMRVGRSAPITGDDTARTDVGAAVTVDVVANDVDIDGDAFTVTGSTDGAHGTVSCTEAGACTYTPQAGFTGSDTFTYTASGTDGPSTGTVRVRVGP